MYGSRYHLGDVRYTVAWHRYSISKALRAIIREQFEGRLSGQEQLSHDVESLRSLAAEICTAIAQLLPRPPPLRANSAEEQLPQPAIENMSQTLKRDWTFSLRASDPLVVTFCSFSAVLLHLMIHKVYCVLYYPFIRRNVSLSTRTRYVILERIS